MTMKDYIITPKESQSYKYLHKIYQLETERRIDSLINYQNWTYPFFRIINNTRKEEVEPFLTVSTLDDAEKEELLSHFPTSNQTLVDNQYVVPGKVIADDEETVLINISILFVNKLHKHQGVTIYNDNFYLSFLSIEELGSYPGVTLIQEGGVIQYIKITKEMWDMINYKPSVYSDENVYLGAWSQNLAYSSTPEHFASYGSRFAVTSTQANPPVTYYDFQSQDEATRAGDYDEDFRENSIASLTQSYLFFEDDFGNMFLPSNQWLILAHIPVGTVLFSNTFLQDINSTLDKALLFHLSDFAGVVWKIYNNQMYLSIVDRMNRDYGTNVILPMLFKDMRFICDTTLQPNVFSQSLSLYGLYNTNKKYKYSGDNVIVQPVIKKGNICEEIIGDFKYQQSISKIENTTNYHYTINNESRYLREIFFLSI